MTLGIERKPMTDWFKVILEAPGRTDNFDIRSGKVRFGSQEIPIRGFFVEWSKNEGNLIYSFPVQEADLKAQGPAFDLSLRSRSLFVVVPVASVPTVLKTLDQCMSSFLAHWGLSLTAQAALAKFPEPAKPVGAYFSNDDYPLSALRRFAIGLIEARVMVHASGKATDCRIIRSSGHPDLDQVTCSNLIRRANFKPAVDHAGKPMTSPFFFSMRWMIPG